MAKFVSWLQERDDMANSCVVSLPKQSVEVAATTENPCKSVKASGTYSTSPANLEIHTEVLTGDFSLKNVAAVFNDTGMVSVKCDGSEIYRVITGSGNPSPSMPVSCIVCPSGSTLSIDFCGPCNGDYFVCIEGELP